MAFPAGIPLLLLLAGRAAFADELEELGRDFWAWRAVHQPLSGDDMPRIERAADWLPDWSRAAVAERQKALASFKKRWNAIDPAGWPVSRQVNYRLIGSALARADWELNVSPGWQQNPLFYIDQTLGSIFDRLLQPPPFDAARSDQIVRRMERIPRTVEQARQNLDQAVGPFAGLAIAELKESRPRLSKVARELKPFLAGPSAGRLEEAAENAILALEAFRSWLEDRLRGMSTQTAAGREAYLFFLKKVALLPYSPEELVAMARQEWERSVAFETYEIQRNRDLPPLPLFPDQAAQMAREEKDEQTIRQFLEEKDLLSVPAWMKHYRNLPLPGYLEPLAHLGVTDDLTSPTRLDQDGVSYISPPSPTLGYFALSTARDPRPILVHEGVPGHYFQLVLSWAHEDPLRRHYHDSGANEGIGFYAEEMMLQAGLFDDSPRTREILYNFMRLRALRVEVDVKLALGEFTISQAARYLEQTVPMDAQTAQEEASFFASSPGQAISYQIGKLQILKFLADARRAQGERFSLRAFHDFVWKNGNVPIALQRWEYLGLADEIEKLDKL